MHLTIVDRLLHLWHPVIVMKDHAFDQGFDDLGQAPEDLERQVAKEAAPVTPAPDDEIDEHLEHDIAEGVNDKVLLH